MVAVVCQVAICHASLGISRFPASFACQHVNQRSLKKDLGNRLQSCNKCHLSPGAFLGCPGGFRVCMITAHPSFTLRTLKVILPKHTMNTGGFTKFSIKVA